MGAWVLASDFLGVDCVFTAFHDGEELLGTISRTQHLSDKAMQAAHYFLGYGWIVAVRWRQQLSKKMRKPVCLPPPLPLNDVDRYLCFSKYPFGFR